MVKAPRILIASLALAGTLGLGMGGPGAAQDWRGPGSGTAGGDYQQEAAIPSDALPEQPGSADNDTLELALDAFWTDTLIAIEILDEDLAYMRYELEEMPPATQVRWRQRIEELEQARMDLLAELDSFDAMKDARWEATWYDFRNRISADLLALEDEVDQSIAALQMIN